ncbi:MAG: type IX secretion system plug protein domain-containing protein [Flavobacteriales bacterium]
MNQRTMLVLLPLLIAACASLATTERTTNVDYWSTTDLRYEDRTYKPSLHTVQLFKEGFELAPPVIELGSADGLVLRFDDFSPDPEYFSYTLVHCDARWQPSDLLPGQYLSGALNDFMPPARQSFNTLQPFLQYEVRIPNDIVRIKMSGNYILKVYRDSDENDLVLTRRFMVYEQKVQIEAAVKAGRQMDTRDAAQQVDLLVRHPGLPVQDPFSEIHVAMLQNMRWDDLRVGFTPRFMRGTELVYDFPEQGLFMGGNEFRNFDLKDLRFTTQQVARIEQGVGETVYHAYLLPEAKRNISVHLEQPDLNGRYFVRNDFFDGDPLGADYVVVHFTLPMPAPLGEHVYVWGAFSDWQCTTENRMTWNADRKAYTAELLLKQGFYDFAYVTLPRGTNTADMSTIEGSHFQTENDYLILVYFTDRMQRCDRLVGVRFLNSRRG